jgi:hypothetical protein
VGTLTERQRLALADALDARERPPEHPPGESFSHHGPAPARAGDLGRQRVHSSGTMPGPTVASSTMWPSGSRR